MDTLAYKIALEAHAGQTRRDGITPYFAHCFAVANHRRIETVTEKAVAFLHDVLEDTTLTASDLIEKGISAEIVEAVKALTKDKWTAYDDYLINVKANPLAKTVKIADMLCNLGDNPTDKQILKYAKGLTFLLK